MVDVLDATSKLDAALETYMIANATEDNPLDRSHLIENPSFEDYTNGWDVISMTPLPRVRTCQSGQCQ